MKENINHLIHNLVNAVKKIEKKHTKQIKKIKLFRKQVNLFKHKLKNKNISVNSYNTYISRARRQFLNIKHHNFNKKITFILKNFPFFTQEINQNFVQPKTTQNLKFKINKFKIKLYKTDILIKNINKLQINSNNTNKIIQLITKIPEWKNELKFLLEKKWYTANKNIIFKTQQSTNLLKKIEKIKIHHEILYILKLEKRKYLYIKKQNLEKLKKKEKQIITINYINYMQKINNILTNNYPLDNIKNFSLTLFALSAVSGRRMIEIIKLGNFKYKNKNEIVFKGQAKTTNKKKYNIYLLYNPKKFIKKIKELRKSKILKKIKHKIKTKKNKYQSTNSQISNYLSNPLNKWVKIFFNNHKRTYKDSRSIYSKIVFEMWFKKHKQWKNTSKDIFFYKILGHKNINNQIHYKQFKLFNFLPQWKPIKKNIILTRINNLSKLDNKLSKIIKRKTAFKIHEITKNLIKKNPYLLINNYLLRKFGFNTRLIQRYIKFIAPYINQKKTKGRYKIIESKNNKIII